MFNTGGRQAGLAGLARTAVGLTVRGLVRLAVTSTGSDRQLADSMASHVTGNARRFAGLACLKVVGIAGAATVDELLAFPGCGVVKPTGNRCIAGTDVSRQATDIVDQAVLLGQALVIAVTPDPHAHCRRVITKQSSGDSQYIGSSHLPR